MCLLLCCPNPQLQQIEAFPVGWWGVGGGGDRVSAAPAQAKYIIEYCIWIIIPRRYKANNSTQ